MDAEKHFASSTVARPVSRNESTYSCAATEGGGAVTLHDATGAITTTTTSCASQQPSFWTRLGVTPESFRRRTREDEHNQLNQTMKGRHLSMIAIGGSIGAGLFVGSGKALATGGPAALLIGFGLIGVMMFNVVYALGELSALYPISGGFYTYSARFIDPSE
jgi:amino acid transporter